MITINNYNEIELKTPQIGEKFEIQKGKRKSIYKIIESANFEGCYELVRCENLGRSCGTYIWKEKSLTGSGSIEGCIKQAYDIT